MCNALKERFYITTPIYYVNAEPHIGHAYTTIVADVLNRFHILAGSESFFLTGTDEHGDKIVMAAAKTGQSPLEYVDRLSALFRDLWPRLNISNDYFIRTTDPSHQDTVARILSLMKDKGDIYFSEYEGRYCFGCERFYTDRELVNGKCPDHLTEPQVIREANYFFRMSLYQQWLIDHIHQNPDFIRPKRYKNEILSFLSEPLEDLCISRPKSRLTWGVTLPFDENYVAYVWFDALINYISALHYPDGDLFKTFWPVAQHIIAKDILKPHGIYWPCMLKSAGIEPYQHLNVHGYWNINEGKMSKSLGNVVNPLDLAEIYGLDAFRYFLLRDMVFGLDSEFSEEALVSRINSDLANDLGNLVSRSLTMVYKYFRGTLPATGPVKDVDDELKKASLAVIDLYTGFMHGLEFHKALMAIWDVINKINKYIDTMAPWELAKTDKERLATVICHIIEPIRMISVLIWPFMPAAAEKIQEGLHLPMKGKELSLDFAREWGNMASERSISKSFQLFPRIDVDKGQRKMPQKKIPSQGGAERARISFDEFQKLDLRIGTIKQAEGIPKSKKLIKLTVDIGKDRTIVAGIAGHYTAEALLGKQVVVAVNLEPVKLMGVESMGMVLAAEDETGVHLLVPDVETRPGSRVK
jgi:methionyl-tRNA synthetase